MEAVKIAGKPFMFPGTREEFQRFCGAFAEIKKGYTITYDGFWRLKRSGKSPLITQHAIEQDIMSYTALALDIQTKAFFLESLFALVEETEAEEEASQGEGQIVEFSLDLKPAERKVIGSTIRWSIIVETGQQLLFVRTHDKAQRYAMVSEPKNILKIIRTLNPKSHEEMLERFMNSSLRNLNSEDGGGVLVQTMDYWFKNAKVAEKILQDDSLQIDMPATLANDQETPCFAYFPLNSLPLLPTPTFDTWLKQMPEELVPVFKAWVYSVFVADNRGRQILFLRDQGYTGKSAFTAALANTLGLSAVCAISKDSLVNQFWGSKILGRRFIVFSDSGNTKIQQMDKLKQISGGDLIDVERKGDDSFPYRPNCRILVTTNSFPEIHLHETHQRTRTIFIPLTPSTDDEVLKTYCAVDANGELIRDSRGELSVVGSDLEDRMTKEFPAFLASCRSDYARLCPKNRDLILPETHTSLIESQCGSEDFENLTHLCKVFLDVTQKDSDRITIAELSQIRARCKDMDMDISSKTLGSYLITLGCQKKKYRVDGGEARGFWGVKLNSQWVFNRGKLTEVKTKTTKSINDDDDIIT